MLLELTVALVVASVLGLAFESARWVGAMGLLMLIFLYPWACLALSIAGGAAFYYFHFYRTNHELLERRDEHD